MHTRARAPIDVCVCVRVHRRSPSGVKLPKMRRLRKFSPTRANQPAAVMSSKANRLRKKIFIRCRFPLCPRRAVDISFDCMETVFSTEHQMFVAGVGLRSITVQVRLHDADRYGGSKVNSFCYVKNGDVNIAMHKNHSAV